MCVFVCEGSVRKGRRARKAANCGLKFLRGWGGLLNTHKHIELSFSLFFTITNHTHELWLIQSQPPHLPAASFSKSLSPHSLFSKTSSLIFPISIPTQHTIPPSISLSFLCGVLFPLPSTCFQPFCSSPTLDFSLHQQTHLIFCLFSFYREELQSDRTTGKLKS